VFVTGGKDWEVRTDLKKAVHLMMIVLMMMVLMMMVLMMMVLMMMVLLLLFLVLFSLTVKSQQSRDRPAPQNMYIFSTNLILVIKNTSVTK
jgi:heme O synthase-like polyprenyltransferase